MKMLLEGILKTTNSSAQDLNDRAYKEAGVVLGRSTGNITTTTTTTTTALLLVDPAGESIEEVHTTQGIASAAEMLALQHENGKSAKYSSTTTKVAYNCLDLDIR